MFDIGDILYTRIDQDESEDYYFKFAVVDGITKSNRYRIQHIGSQYGEQETEYLDSGSINGIFYPVTPNIYEKYNDGILIEENGLRDLDNGSYRFYKKYSPYLNLKNFNRI